MPPSLADHGQQPASTRMILPGRTQMLSQRIDSMREDGNLNLRGAAVGITPAVLRDNPLFVFSRDGHHNPFCDRCLRLNCRRPGIEGAVAGTLFSPVWIA